MLQKYHSNDLLNFNATYEAQNADNTRTLGKYDLTTNSVKFMQQRISPLSEGESSVCN